jgi:hypothetical protein
MLYFLHPEYVTGQDRFVSLHLNAQQRDFRLEGQRQEQAEKERRELFRPLITDKALKLAAER